LPKEILEILLEIYNCVLRASVYPDDRKKYTRVFEERNTASDVFDIKSAYDIYYGTLMDRLKVVGFSGNLLAYIFSLVSSRELEAN
jgi:hypothetical protein